LKNKSQTRTRVDWDFLGESVYIGKNPGMESAQQKEGDDGMDIKKGRMEWRKRKEAFQGEVTSYHFSNI